MKSPWWIKSNAHNHLRGDIIADWEDPHVYCLLINTSRPETQRGRIFAYILTTSLNSNFLFHYFTICIDVSTTAGALFWRIYETYVFITRS